ncbi:MAG: hypothetical protein M5U12_18280 [Verrucomicrobia bacterium]|nr:hypothetical protein [Verrucomicrobiota bacterium]
MKTSLPNIVGALSLGLGLTLLVGCSSQQPAASSSAGTVVPPVFTESGTVGTVQRTAPAPRSTAAPAAPAPKPAAAPAPAAVPAGDGLRKGSAAFPTGNPQSSAVLVEYLLPTEVIVGEPFDMIYRISNLTDGTLRDVIWTSDMPENFRADQATPEPDRAEGGVALWNLGEFAPKQSKEIRIRGVARQEGTITGCGSVTYVPVVCDTIRVVRAAMELVKTMPGDVILCDPIPVRLVVKNTGSSALTGVRVVDDLPEGLLADGRRTVAFDAGTLRPGESKEFTFNATAARTGKFNNVAKATSAQGISAEDAKAVTVRQPLLEIACSAPDERFAGRPIEVCYTVKNTGDAPLANAKVDVVVPAGISFRGASAGGTLSGNIVTWPLGTLAPNATKEVCLTLVGEVVGTYSFSGTAAGTCAKPVTTACSTKVSGIPAILLEVIDIEDPIEVGKTETYRIEVTNQGSAPDTNIRIVCELEDAQEFVSGTGPTAVTAVGRQITMAPLASLAPKDKAVWQVVVRALKPANVRFKTTMTSDQLTRPVEETESTNQY